MLAFLIRTLFAVNSNHLEHSQKVEAFINAYSTNFEEDQRIRKTTARVLKKLADDQEY